MANLLCEETGYWTKQTENDRQQLLIYAKIHGKAYGSLTQELSNFGALTGKPAIDDQSGRIQEGSRTPAGRESKVFALAEEKRCAPRRRRISPRSRRGF